MLVGFLSPIEMFVVLQEPTLTPFSKKKKVETKKVMWNHAYLISIFFYLYVTLAVGISYDVSGYV